jgi:hypothetical protein
MSHFLARLVERARGTAPRVEPLLAPQYAPSALLDVVTEVEAPPLPRRESRKHKAPVASERRAVRSELPDAAKNSPRESAVETASPELLVPLERPAREVAQPPNRTRGSESLRRNELPLVQSVAESPIVRRTHSDPPAANPPVRAIPPPNGNIPPNEKVPHERPIVRVTIGRIEVRASPAAAPSPRKMTPAAPPLLSLDAYAQAKKEGRR